MRKLIIGTVAGLLLLVPTAALAGNPHHDDDVTAVPGHEDRTSGTVVGNYEANYYEDASGAYYWDLGDGRVYTSQGVTSPNDLDPETVVHCRTAVHYRGDFGGDPFLNVGMIQNRNRCDNGFRNNVIIVHESDPRYTGDGPAIWGTWEYHINTQGGNGDWDHGNLLRPTHHVG